MKKVLILLCVVCLIFAMVGNGNATLWNEYEYRVFFDPHISWELAETAVNNLAGDWYLATITSQDEQHFLKYTLLAGWIGQYWLGGYQDQLAGEPDSDWQWASGEDWDYTNWAGGEPNDYYGSASEQHLATWYRYGWKWNDEGNLGNISGYIAERSAPAPIPNPEPGTLLLFGTGLVGFAGIKRKFRAKA